MSGFVEFLIGCFLVSSGLTAAWWRHFVALERKQAQSQQAVHAWAHA